MRLVFLGTRGYIDARSRRHRRHSALRISRGGTSLLIDCGEDWLSRLPFLRPGAIVITHAHPDHAGGLKRGAPCPVYATREIWETMPPAGPLSRRVLPHRKPRRIRGVTFEAFPVVHSIRAPAVGYRIAAGRARLFYVPDVAAIPHARAALSGIDLYVGDGATPTRPILRRRAGTLIGHIPIRTQLGWCRDNRVSRALFTHCGSQIVSGAEPRLREAVRRMGQEHGVEADLAHDGMAVVLP